MTFHGWIGYLKCFFLGHKLRSYKRRYGGSVLHCDRCPHPHADTLHSWLVRRRFYLQHWWQNRHNKHDDLLF